jgi:hypothetical protein
MSVSPIAGKNGERVQEAVVGIAKGTGTIDPSNLLLLLAAVPDTGTSY